MAGLVELMEYLLPEDGALETGWPGLTLVRKTEPMMRTPVVYVPSVCVVARGAKRAYLGDQIFEYNPMTYLVSAMTMPIESEITQASPDHPFLALVLRLDPAVVARLLVDIDDAPDPPDATGTAAAEAVDQEGAAAQPAIYTAPIGAALENALVRLIEAVADPLDRHILGATVVREVTYLLMRQDRGRMLRQSALRDSTAHRISRVVRYLEEHYARPLDIPTIARHAGMSSSALHQHFKRVTTLSPIQFLKKIRLHEARLMLVSGASASEAADRVGYASPSQFSREFRRLFGQPPSQLRGVA